LSSSKPFKEFYDLELAEHLFARKDSFMLAKKHIQIIQRSFPIPRKLKILDIPAGAGRYSKIFFEMGLQVTAVDLSEKMQILFRKTCPGVKFYRKSVRQVKERYPLVFSAGGLGYEKNLDSVFSKLRNIGQKVQTKGTLILLLRLADYLDKNEVLLFKEKKFTTCLEYNKKQRALFWHFQKNQAGSKRVSMRQSILYKTEIQQALKPLGFKDFRWTRLHKKSSPFERSYFALTAVRQ
jgi:hypothetical protein